jgi:hypothetical protein
MSFTKQVQFHSGVVVILRWPDFKPLALAKALRIQYVEYDDGYTVFAHDGDVVYTCDLIKLASSATYPFANYTPDYDRTQNDTDVAEFEASYKSGGNSLVRAVDGLVDFVSGYSATSTNTRASILATAYTEPLSAAQRSISSSSTSDTAAGTGARTVRITYYDNTMAGPLTETVTLNGTTAVNTVASNIRFIESLQVITAGSGGNNAGILTMFNTTAGGGGALGTVAINDNQTNWCHHYVGVNKTFFLSQVVCGNQGSCSGNLTVLTTTPTVANSTDFVVIPQIRIPPGETTSVDFKSPISVTGPSRVILQIKQDAASGANNWFAGFSYQEV